MWYERAASTSSKFAAAWVTYTWAHREANFMRLPKQGHYSYVHYEFAGLCDSGRVRF